MEYLYIGMMAVLVVCAAFLQSLIGLGYVLLVAPFLISTFDHKYIRKAMLAVSFLAAIMVIIKTLNL